MRFEPIDILIYTFKEGLLSAVAHDLELRATRLAMTASHSETGDLRIEVGVEADSLRVQTAMEGGRPRDVLSAADKRTIERTIADEVLDARRHPKIRFTGRVTGAGDRRHVEGVLGLHGHDRPLSFEAVRAGDRWRAEVPLHQPDWGIKPYSAMLGTLKVRPGVIVKLAAPVNEIPDAPVPPSTE